jgi:hypothetical protein
VKNLIKLSNYSEHTRRATRYSTRSGACNMMIELKQQNTDATNQDEFIKVHQIKWEKNGTEQFRPLFWHDACQLLCSFEQQRHFSWRAFILSITESSAKQSRLSVSQHCF